jgi:diguanylate cyclase (GGDEF)-like protein
MSNAPTFPDEQERLATLRSLPLLDTPIEERFERITRMVCRTLDVPVCLFNLIDDRRQYFKSVQGQGVTEVTLRGAICTHTLHEPDILVVSNTKEDTRFVDSPFVNGELTEVQFYAGCPVRAPNGQPIGTLCAIDVVPRHMTEDQLATLRDLRAMVETELKAHSLAMSQTKLIKQLDNANRLLLIDPLTRIWNRKGIEQLLHKEWAEALEQDRPVTIAMADIDYFKKINDTFGHPAGDAVLQSFAKRLLEAGRAEDIVGRMSGEEFIVILHETDPNKVYETADRFRRAVEARPMKTPSGAYPVTVSIGVGTARPSEIKDYAALIKRADEALYLAKYGGRNKVHIA